MLQRNLFPKKMISGILEKVRTAHNNQDAQEPEESSQSEESAEQTQFLKLPFTGSSSVLEKVKKVVKKYCKTTTNVRIIFDVSKISSFFSTKDRTPDHLTSNVVYQFKCLGCNATYIGETRRHLCTRIEEHTEKDKNSHIFKHLLQNPECRKKF